GEGVFGRTGGCPATPDHQRQDGFYPPSPQRNSTEGGSRRHDTGGKFAAVPPGTGCRQVAAFPCCSWRSGRREPRSSPVSWSTWRMLSFTFPRSSKPSTLTLTASPSLTTSATLPTRCGASSLIWTSPSRDPRKFTKAPKSTTFTTLPL